MSSSAAWPSGSRTRWGGNGGRLHRRPEGRAPDPAGGIMPGTGGVPALRTARIRRPGLAFETRGTGPHRRATGGRQHARRRSVPGGIRWRSATSGTRSRTLNDYEGRPEARPFTREELQRFMDYADEQVDRAVRSGRKGALAAYRDATIFKVIYGWGLRRTETARLDVADFGRNPRAPRFGRYGTLNVRYGKAKRGQPPRRRNGLSVMGWAVEAVAHYVGGVRPRIGAPATRRRGAPRGAGGRTRAWVHP